MNSIVGRDNNKTKKEKKIHKEKEKPKTLDEKYEYLSQKFLKGKRNYTPKKKENEKQVLNKKRERTDTENKNNKKKDKHYNTSNKKDKKEKYKIGKIDKVEKNDEDDFEDDKELFGFSPEVKKKLDKRNDEDD